MDFYCKKKKKREKTGFYWYKSQPALVKFLDSLSQP